MGDHPHLGHIVCWDLDLAQDLDCGPLCVGKQEYHRNDPDPSPQIWQAYASKDHLCSAVSEHEQNYNLAFSSGLVLLTGLDIALLSPFLGGKLVQQQNTGQVPYWAQNQWHTSCFFITSARRSNSAKISSISGELGYP